MTQTAHTPGPWKINWQMHNLRIFQDKGDTWNIASIASTRREKTEQEANAALIAAAPELLAALQAITAAMPLNGGMVRFDGDELAAARAAIAKATGQ